jgi:hypothetical protein
MSFTPEDNLRLAIRFGLVKGDLEGKSNAGRLLDVHRPDPNPAGSAAAPLPAWIER